MKTHTHSLVQGALRLAVALFATSLCFGAEPFTTGTQVQPTAAETTALEKKKVSTRRAEEKRAQVTGSRISYKVKNGKKTPDTALTVTVIDPNSAVNRGYSGALEALMHNPSVYRGR
jgi:hypothetical protein